MCVVLLRYRVDRFEAYTHLSAPELLVQQTYPLGVDGSSVVASQDYKRIRGDKSQRSLYSSSRTSLFQSALSDIMVVQKT